MALGPYEREAIAFTLRRLIPIATLRRIHQHIEDDKADELNGQKLAGVVTGAVIGLFFAYFLPAFLLSQLRIERSSPFSGAEMILSLGVVTLYSVMIVVPFTLAYYFKTAYPGPVRSYLVRGLIVSVGFGVLFSACAAFVRPITGCEVGRAAAAQHNYEKAIREYTTCLGFPNLTHAARVEVLQARAVAHSTIGQNSHAAADYTAADRRRAEAQRP